MMAHAGLPKNVARLRVEAVGEARVGDHEAVVAFGDREGTYAAAAAPWVRQTMPFA